MKNLLTILVVTLVPSLVLAHGDTTSQSQQAGDYKVELEYSTQGSIMQNEFVGYSVHVMDASDKQVAFDWAFVRITNGSLPVLSGKAVYDPNLEDGTAILSGMIPRAGDYNVQVTISKDGNLLPAVNFPLMVKGEGSETNSKKFSFDWVSGLIGLGIGVLIAVVGTKRRV